MIHKRVLNGQGSFLLIHFAGTKAHDIVSLLVISFSFYCTLHNSIQQGLITTLQLYCHVVVFTETQMFFCFYYLFTLVIKPLT